MRTNGEHPAGSIAPVGQLRNPYLNKSTVFDREMFFGREKEIGLIREAIGSDPPMSVNITGDRKIGKSSLMLHACRPDVAGWEGYNPTRFLFLWFDAIQLEDPQHFMQIVQQRCAERLDRPELTQVAGLRSMLQRIPDKCIVVQIDEFEHLPDHVEDCARLLHDLNSLVQIQTRNMAFVVTSEHSIERYFPSDPGVAHEVAQRFKVLRLRPFAHEDAVNLITVPSEKAGIPLAPYLDEILDLAGYFPALIQAACSCFFDALRWAPESVRDNLDHVLRDFTDDVQPLFDGIWQGLTKEEQQMCAEISRGGRAGPAGRMDDLMDRGFIVSRQGAAKLFPASFEQFVRSRIPPPPDMPDELGPYKIIDRIGEGGMGQVYKAMHKTLRQVRAVKILNANLTANKEFVERFHREAMAMAMLEKCENVVRLYEAYSQESFHYFAMEYIDGGSLMDRCETRNISEDWLVDVAIQICNALIHAHGKQFVHRDIKPANILITSEDVAKLSDFGLVKLLEEQGLLTGDPTRLMGTLPYMSPEQRHLAQSGFAMNTTVLDAEADKPLAAPIDHRSDIYSLGATLHFAAFGALPSNEVLPMKNRPEAIAPHRLPVSPEFHSILRKMIEVDRENRYQSAGELKEALLELRQKQRRSPEVPGTPPETTEPQTEDSRQATNETARLAVGLGIPFLLVAIILAEALIGVSYVKEWGVVIACTVTFILASLVIHFAGRYVNVIHETTYYRFVQGLLDLVQTMVTNRCKGKAPNEGGTDTDKHQE